MLQWTGDKTNGSGTWSASCVQFRCSNAVEIVGSKNEIAGAATFLETNLGWRRDARKGRAGDRCEWTCVDCKVRQLEGASRSRGSIHTNFAGGGKK